MMTMPDFAISATKLGIFALMMFMVLLKLLISVLLRLSNFSSLEKFCLPQSSSPLVPPIHP